MQELITVVYPLQALHAAQPMIMVLSMVNVHGPSSDEDKYTMRNSW